jgi:hypothetical protein
MPEGMPTLLFVAALVYVSWQAYRVGYREALRTMKYSSVTLSPVWEGVKLVLFLWVSVVVFVLLVSTPMW